MNKRVKKACVKNSIPLKDKIYILLRCEKENATEDFFEGIVGTSLWGEIWTSKFMKLIGTQMNSKRSLRDSIIKLSKIKAKERI